MTKDPNILKKLAIIEESNRRLEEARRNIQAAHNLDERRKDRALIVRGLRGLGDNINQHAFLRELDFPFYLDTPWPELYSDIPNATLVPCSTILRTQNKNLKRQPEGRFKNPPEKDVCDLLVQYGSRDLAVGSMYKKLSQIFGGIKPKSFSIPKFPIPQFEWYPLDKKVVVVRPATVRKEWAAVSRNPDPQYLYQACELLRKAGFFVVSVCDLEDGHEWIVGEPPPADVRFHKGELVVEELLALCQMSDALLGGHGFLTHVALAEKKPMFVIAGGFGGDNSPHQVADPEFMDVSCLTWAIPDNFCKCTAMNHASCDKHISNFQEKVQAWINNIR